MSDSFRLRIAFAKQGRLRWLSHLELSRALERLIRRSGLPYAVSQGFNRHMRFASSPALPVGTSGLHELFDVWLTKYVSPEEALGMLQAAAGDAIPVLGVEYVSSKLKGLQATHTAHRYIVTFRYNQNEGQAEQQADSEQGTAVSAKELEGLQASLDALRERSPLTLTSKGKAKNYDLNGIIIEPFTIEGTLASDGSIQLTCSLRNSNEGSLRPEQYLLAALGSQVEVVSVTRLSLEA
ncbi:MAG: TIGR03936 family radical SAM-associated protein [Coriobacteriia bacterium]|nr:TIGR03936 family radical SAM-associated protein [Coriobacteriia bacterium]